MVPTEGNERLRVWGSGFGLEFWGQGLRLQLFTLGVRVRVQGSGIEVSMVPTFPTRHGLVNYLTCAAC